MAALACGTVATWFQTRRKRRESGQRFPRHFRRIPLRLAGVSQGSQGMATRYKP
jgi:hypothetical protein